MAAPAPKTILYSLTKEAGRVAAITDPLLRFYCIARTNTARQVALVTCAFFIGFFGYTAFLITDHRSDFLTNPTGGGGKPLYGPEFGPNRVKGLVNKADRNFWSQDGTTLEFAAK